MSQQGWEIPGPATASVDRREVVRTGPSGLLLGPTSEGRPVTVRIFRPEPTRALVSTRDYMKWILIFRAVTVGADTALLLVAAVQFLAEAFQPPDGLGL